MVRLAAALLVVVAPGWAPASAGAGAPADEAAFETRLAEARQSLGLAPLAVAPDLVAVARRHSSAMAARRSVFHNPRLTSEVEDWELLGENVGTGPSVDKIHRAFMGSQVHRDEILRADFTQVGVGVVHEAGALWVTQVFRRPAGASAEAPAPGPTAAPPGAAAPAPRQASRAGATSAAPPGTARTAATRAPAGRAAASTTRGAGPPSAPAATGTPTPAPAPASQPPTVPARLAAPAEAGGAAPLAPVLSVRRSPAAAGRPAAQLSLLAAALLVGVAAATPVAARSRPRGAGRSRPAVAGGAGRARGGGPGGAAPPPSAAPTVARVGRLVVDGMNVIGSRPDGWWRDRDGAVRSLLARLQRLVPTGDEEVVLVLDGRPLDDVAEGDHGGVRVLYARRPGRDGADHRILDLLAAPDGAPALVVTSDRALADAARSLGAEVSGAGSLLRRLDALG